MKLLPFNREKHVYQNDAFAELVKDAVRFFNGTPVQPVPPAERFAGTGVYALYYTGKLPLYAPYAKANRLAYNAPIYVGKAVPKGWRQSRTAAAQKSSFELYQRLTQHANNAALVQLKPGDFSSRFVIFESAGSDLISTLEASLIKLNRPLWNSCVDGFGNHDPGRGRYEQALSDWDVLHPGRAWAVKCKGTPKSRAQIEARIAKHFEAAQP